MNPFPASTPRVRASRLPPGPERTAVRPCVTALLGVLGWALAAPGWAGVSCRLTCANDTAECRAALALVTARAKAPTLANCQDDIRSHEHALLVWYARRAALVVKAVPPRQPIGPLVSDGDPDCEGLLCLFRQQVGQVSGANPMGSGSGVAPTSAEAITWGLPYGELRAPGAGLLVRARPGSPVDAADGMFVLLSAAGEELGRWPIGAGSTQLPPGAVQPAGRYGFRWEAGSRRVSGSFTVTRSGTSERVDAMLAKRVAEQQLQGAGITLQMVSVLVSAGLYWDARQLMDSVDAK